MLRELKKKNSCVNTLRDPPALVRFDGTGLKTDGYICSYDAVAQACYTDVVKYVAGSGIQPFSEKVVIGGYCSGGTFVDFDGTGLKPLSYPEAVC
jgi:hypothetical protein